MKIRVGTLRRLIREVAISPSYFKNNEPVRDIMDRPNMAKAVAALEQPFRNAVQNNMVLAAKGQYNPETRELDDQAYEHIKQTSDKATEMMMAGVHKAVTQAFAQAQKGGAREEAPATSGAQPKRAVA
jgi:hypothetical protein